MNNAISNPVTQKSHTRCAALERSGRNLFSGRHRTRIIILSYPTPVNHKLNIMPTAARYAVSSWGRNVPAYQKSILSRLRHKNLAADSSRITPQDEVFPAFSPRDALLMGYRITKNTIYGIGNGVPCTTRMIMKGRQPLVALRHSLVKQISKSGASVHPTGLGERRTMSMNN